MLAKKHHPLVVFLNIIVFSAVLLFDCNGFLSITIKNATPLLALPLITAFSIFATPQAGAVAGFIIGAVLDSVMAGSYCFNTIAFLLLGVAISLAANNLFNKNIRAAAALSVIIAVIYYTAYWLTFMAFGVGIKNSLIYLLSYGMPSALYSAVFIFPFFYLYKYFDRLAN